ncbi:MAG: RNA polymerase sigma-70 factor [Prolixibacteraceae bacterium]
MTVTETQLIEKIKNSDDVAFKIIYNKYFPRLYYFIYEFIGLDDLTENVVQDTFATFWEKRHTLRDDLNVSSYLYSVAKNNCLYRLRDQRYKQKLFVSGSPDSMELAQNLKALDSVDTSALVFHEIEQIIEKTLEELPPQCKKVFMLSRFEGMKNREIAEELHITTKAVEGHITRSLKLFRSALKDYLPFVTHIFLS